jgi:hypothetical protein
MRFHEALSTSIRLHVISTETLRSNSMFKTIAILGLLSAGAGYGLYTHADHPNNCRLGGKSSCALAKDSPPCCAIPCPACSTGCETCCDDCDACCSAMRELTTPTSTAKAQSCQVSGKAAVAAKAAFCCVISCAACLDSCDDCPTCAVDCAACCDPTAK